MGQLKNVQELGVSMVEYILVIGLIVMGLLWFNNTFMQTLENSYQNHNEEFNYLNSPVMVP